MSIDYELADLEIDRLQDRITQLEAALKRIVEAKALMSEALANYRHDEAMTYMKELHAGIEAAAPLIEKVKK